MQAKHILLLVGLTVALTVLLSACSTTNLGGDATTDETKVSDETITAFEDFKEKFYFLLSEEEYVFEDWKQLQNKIEEVLAYETYEPLETLSSRVNFIITSFEEVQMLFSEEKYDLALEEVKTLLEEEPDFVAAKIMLSKIEDRIASQEDEEELVECVDLAGGADEFTFDYVTGAYESDPSDAKVLHDSCAGADGVLLYESVCGEDGFITTREFECEFGCESGACLDGSLQILEENCQSNYDSANQLYEEILSRDSYNEDMHEQLLDYLNYILANCEDFSEVYEDASSAHAQITILLDHSNDYLNLWHELNYRYQKIMLVADPFELNVDELKAVLTGFDELLQMDPNDETVLSKKAALEQIQYCYFSEDSVQAQKLYDEAYFNEEFVEELYIDAQKAYDELAQKTCEVPYVLDTLERINQLLSYPEEFMHFFQKANHFYQHEKWDDAYEHYKLAFEIVQDDEVNSRLDELEDILENLQIADDTQENETVDDIQENETVDDIQENETVDDVVSDEESQDSQESSDDDTTSTSSTHHSSSGTVTNSDFNSPTPTSSVENGTYEVDECLEVELAVNTTYTKVYYTLDGSEPTQEEGLEYNTTLCLEPGQQTLKYISHQLGKAPSDVIKQSFVITSTQEDEVVQDVEQEPVQEIVEPTSEKRGFFGSIGHFFNCLFSKDC
ncbi:MAG: FN3 associated domain-containing protein [Candidatus Nanoarchaeia archaeon]